jgi:hypothetical protein
MGASRPAIAFLKHQIREQVNRANMVNLCGRPPAGSKPNLATVIVTLKHVQPQLPPLP